MAGRHCSLLDPQRPHLDPLLDIPAYLYVSSAGPSLDRSGSGTVVGRTRRRTSGARISEWVERGLPGGGLGARPSHRIEDEAWLNVRTIPELGRLVILGATPVSNCRPIILIT